MSIQSRVVSVFISLIVSALTVFSQVEEKTAVGFSFVNAVNSLSPTFVKLNGSSYRPPGYPLGSLTDGGMLYSGSYVMEISNSECKPFVQSIKVDQGQSPVYVAYSVDSQKADGTVERKLACLTLSNLQKPNSKSAFYGVFASAEGSAKVTVNGATIVLEAFKVALISEKTPCLLEVDGMRKVLSPQDGGNFFVIFYRKGEKIGFSAIKDSRIVEKRME